MTYEITSSDIFESNFNAAGDYEAIIDNLERSPENCPNLREACAMQAESYAEQFDANDSEFDAYWDVEWATNEYVRLVTDQLLDDATRLYLFSVTEPRPGFEYLHDEEDADYGHCKVIGFAGHEVTIHTSEDEDTVIECVKK